MRLTKKVVKRSVNIYMEFQEVTLVKKCREKMNKILFKRCVFTTSETNFFIWFFKVLDYWQSKGSGFKPTRSLQNWPSFLSFDKISPRYFWGLCG